MQEPRTRTKLHIIGSGVLWILAAATIAGFFLPWFSVLDVASPVLAQNLCITEPSGATLLINNFARWPICLIVGIPAAAIAAIAIPFVRRRQHWLALLQTVAIVAAGYGTFRVVNYAKTMPVYEPHIGLLVVICSLGLLLVSGVLLTVLAIRKK